METKLRLSAAETLFPADGSSRSSSAANSSAVIFFFSESPSFRNRRRTEKSRRFFQSDRLSAFLSAAQGTRTRQLVLTPPQVAVIVHSPEATGVTVAVVAESSEMVQTDSSLLLHSTSSSSSTSVG